MRRSAWVFALTGILVSLAGRGEAAEQGFADWLSDFRAEASRDGVSEATLSTALTGISPIPRVLELDRSQPESRLGFTQYRDRIVTDTRIRDGRERLGRNREALMRVQRDTGVPARVVVALWGIETNYGRLTGGFKVVPALATLAYDGRRSSYFRTELLNALHIIDEGHVSAEAMSGSWAGAMGQCQFMPSSFRRFAVDGNGDGRRDIWGTEADVFASAANYLERSGWKAGQLWGRPVRIPAGFDESLAGLDTRQPLSFWAARGVVKANGAALPTDDMTASLLIPDGKNGPAYLIYDNFRVIMRWNNSTSFALSVGLLADEVGRYGEGPGAGR
jgi:membrane-bound lytic murein transglycosylase B